MGGGGLCDGPAVIPSLAVSELLLAVFELSLAMYRLLFYFHTTVVTYLCITVFTIDKVFYWEWRRPS